MNTKKHELYGFRLSYFFGIAIIYRADSRVIWRFALMVFFGPHGMLDNLLFTRGGFPR
jgi:hypothetical protein